MRRSVFQLGFVVAILAILMWVAGPAAAEKPSWSGNGNGNPHSDGKEHSRPKGGPQKDHGKGHSGSGGHGGGYDTYFGSRDRGPIDHYYAERFRRGKCPPGLAKRGNGCRPPGQAKKWRLHHPLPREVVYHDLPAEVTIQLGLPPVGHRFVRVAQDILLLATGTGMVVDAMEDLGGTLGR